MIKEKIGYSYNDLTIVPKTISKIESRSQIDVFYHKEGYVNYPDKKVLPIFTAPMASVVSDLNYKIFQDNYIIPIIPRNIPIEKRREFLENQIDVWIALSLKEFENLFIKNYPQHNQGCTYKVCVDIANGHMEKLYKLCVKAKEISTNSGLYNLHIMTGNIANPNTYKYICDNCIYKDNKGYIQQAIDYIRVGIGGGSGCFIDGTKVKTLYGDKNIEDITSEDKVLTIDGTYQKVLSTIRYKTNNLVKINNEITSTKNHKYFVINKKDKDIINEDNLEQYGYWVEASKLNKDIHLLVKKY